MAFGRGMVKSKQIVLRLHLISQHCPHLVIILTYCRLSDFRRLRCWPSRSYAVDCGKLKTRTKLGSLELFFVWQKNIDNLRLVKCGHFSVPTRMSGLTTLIINVMSA